jgi:hypothetical protein
MLALEFVGAAAQYLFEDVCCSIGDAVRRLPCGKHSRVIIRATNVGCGLKGVCSGSPIRRGAAAGDSICAIRSRRMIRPATMWPKPVNIGNKPRARLFAGGHRDRMADGRSTVAGICLAVRGRESPERARDRFLKRKPFLEVIVETFFDPLGMSSSVPFHNIVDEADKRGASLGKERLDRYRGKSIKVVSALHVLRRR